MCVLINLWILTSMSKFTSSHVMMDITVMSIQSLFNLLSYVKKLFLLRRCLVRTALRMKTASVTSALTSSAKVPLLVQNVTLMMIVMLGYIVHHSPKFAKPRLMLVHNALLLSRRAKIQSNV